jgi:hypothetical protein
MAALKPSRSTLAARSPWLPSDYEPADAGALQALQRGDATPDQQKRALQFVIHVLCGTYDATYYPGADGVRDSDYAAGKRWVGLQIVKLLNLALSRLKSGPSEQP